MDTTKVIETLETEVPKTITEFSKAKKELLQKEEFHSTDEMTTEEKEAWEDGSKSSNSSKHSDAIKNSEIDPVDMRKFNKSLNAMEKPEGPPPITWREIRALKKARYFETKDNFEVAYVLKNKKTKQIAEIQAATSYQACKIIGWKPKQVKVIETVNVKEREDKIHQQIDEFETETSGSSKDNG